MGISNLRLTKNTLEMQSEELTNQIADNSMDMRTIQKYASNDIQDVKNQFAPQKEYINNQIQSLDKQENKDEYHDLLTELKDIKEEEADAIERIEQEVAIRTNDMQVERESDEVRLEAINQDIKTYDEMLNEEIQEEFSYFDN